MAEVTAFRNNALPYPIFGYQWAVVFPILDADGDLVTGATGLDSERSLNGDTFSDCTNEATEIATSSGMYYLLLTAAEMSADIVTVIVKTTSVGAKTTPMVFYTKKIAAYYDGTAQTGDASTITLDSGASPVNGAYNGMVCSVSIDGTAEERVIYDYVGSTKVATVSRPWVGTIDSNDPFEILAYEGPQTPDNNVIAISGDMTAANNAEAFFDGTGYAGTNNTMPTTTTVTNIVTANVTQISGDSAAADNAETAFDGGSFNVGGGGIVAASVTGAVGSVTGAVGSVTGAVGSVTGSVGGNVTGSVGSVAGNVAGNVVGSVGSVVGAVGSVTGAVGSVTGNVGGNVNGNVVGDVQGNVDGEVGAIGTGGITALSFAAGAIDEAAVSQDFLDAIATNLLAFDWDGFTGEADRSLLNALRFLRNRWSISGGTLTVYKENDSTAAWTGVVTQTAGDPVSQIDPVGP